jgi:DUF4097 and DUF4098 domain-containing protein YvlB
MRRGSLIGPMLLILIGALFLINNLRPELPILQMIGDYWPFVLIGWGVLRLLEITWWYLSGREVPGNGVSGGEWGLVIFLCIFGTALFYGHRYAERWPHGRIMTGGLEMLGESFDFQLAEQKRAVGKTPRILIENLRGNARVTGADTEELKVAGRTTVRAFQRTDAERVYKEAPLEVVTQGDLIVVRTNQDRPSGPQRISSDLEITVPKGSIIKTRGRVGDFDITEVASVEVDSDNAGVRVNNIAGDVRVELRKSDIIRATNVKGNVDLKGSGWDVELENIAGQASVNGSYSGELTFRNLAKPLRFESRQTELRVEKITGQLRMGRGDLSAHGVDGPVVLKGGSRDIDFSDFTQSLEISVDRGDIELRPGKLPMAKIDARTRSGNIHFAAPPAAKFQMRASTNRGDIDNEFGAPLEISPEGRGKRLTGVVGGGGPEVQLTCDRGSVTVRKASSEAAPLPPEAPGTPKPPAPPKSTSLKVEEQ